MTSRPAQEAVSDLAALLCSVMQGTLQMFGDWSGRRWDNIYIVRSVGAGERDLIVGFNR